jgi:hypothetical protein
MTNPIAVLLFQSLDNYNRITAASPEKHTLPKALIYTIGTSIIAAVLYKTLTKNSRSSHSHSHQRPFLSAFLKPFHTIFGNTADTAETTTHHDTTTQLPFEEKYFKEYDEWTAQKERECEREREHNTLSIAEEDHLKECLENMYYSTVRETINDFYGDIIMCYDHATLSFAYYARTGNIPYKYLETISRKYMIETNAPRDIHVDIRSEYQKAKERNNPTATDTTATATDTTTTTDTTVAGGRNPQNESVEVGQEDVFAKLKSYNTAYNLHAKTTTTTNDRNVKITQTPSSTETQQSSSAILRENANRYSYRGKITDFDEHHKTFLAERRNANTVNTASDPQNEPVAGGRNPQSYAEFKKRISAL